MKKFFFVLLMFTILLSNCDRYKLAELEQEVSIFSKWELKNLSEMDEKDIVEFTDLAERIREDQNKRQRDIFPSTGQRLV
jgi:hypothetical protein